MCDLSEKLVAWLDHELPRQEAADLGQHLQSCAECRNRLDSYKEVSKAIDAYCDAATGSDTRATLPRWAPVLSAAAAAAAVALLLLFPHGRVERHPPQAPVAASPAVVLEAPLKARLEATSASISQRVRRRHAVVAPVQSRNANWVPTEPAIQIAFPVDTMFAPGAVPQGLSFTAELSIAADGSAQQLRLRP